MRIFISFLLSCVVAYILFLTYLYLNQRSMMYHPEGELNSLSHYSLSATEEITLITSDGIKLQAWYRKPNDNKHMVIFLHGNAGNLENRVDKLEKLIKMGYGFIIPAWRGFGKSSGKASMKGLYQDAEAAISFIKSRDYELENTILIGESLGTGIAAEMATRYRFKGLFLITPYKSIAARADELYPLMLATYLTKDNFNVIDKISSINQPVLIIHGTEDNVVPCSHSEEIFTKAKEPKKMIIYPGVGHSDYDIQEVFVEMSEFFKSHQ
jgi:uncharacterized protein